MAGRVGDELSDGKGSGQNRRSVKERNPTAPDIPVIRVWLVGCIVKRVIFLAARGQFAGGLGCEYGSEPGGALFT